MTRITESLIRKRAEHNNCEISTLEEVSLHQQDIDRIENIDRWCRELKILYLQSNLIPKIENVGKLKKLEYLNLALNNVERVENLEACESLKKLDLTVNFVGELTSIECLKDLYQFEELYLTGNPCTDYDGYRDYCIAALPKLRRLDGVAIEKSERIKAVQEYSPLKEKIILQQEQYKRKREKEKEEANKKKEKEVTETKPGFDGRWYTDINSGDKKSTVEITELTEEDEGTNADEEDSKFWNEKCAFTPESRLEVHEQIQKQKKREEKDDKGPQKRERKLFTDDGRPLNVNEAKMDFSLTEDEDENTMMLDVPVYKHLDTSLLDVDVQTTYVKVVIKGKIFQLVLPEEVNPDKSNAKRSQITGHLVITMPKAKAVIKAPKPKELLKENKADDRGDRPRKTCERLEVDPSKAKKMDYGNIYTDKKIVPPLGHRDIRKQLEERPNSEDFVDDPDVPPLF
ncbi:dynein axonemal assembly factor 11-like [Lineus longissimus]|uniref:dynein axonemal assembly factor 11-like n=1 Tax=Lineus longissimus TaxID=88925 RepID=UPI002B4ED747